MNKKLFPLFTLTILLVLLSLPVIAQAINIVDIMGRIQKVLNDIYYGLVIMMTVIVGILYLTARGDPSRVTAANKALIWTIVGVAVGLLANPMFDFVSFILFGRKE